MNRRLEEEGTVSIEGDAAAFATYVGLRRLVRTDEAQACERCKPRNTEIP